MKFFLETKEGFAVNIAKIEALGESINKEVIARAVGDRPHLPTVKHGKNRVFFPVGTFPKEEAALLEKDLQGLAKAARFRGIKSRIKTIKQAVKFAIS